MKIPYKKNKTADFNGSVFRSMIYYFLYYIYYGGITWLILLTFTRAHASRL